MVVDNAVFHFRHSYSLLFLNLKTCKLKTQMHYQKQIQSKNELQCKAAGKCHTKETLASTSKSNEVFLQINTSIDLMNKIEMQLQSLA